ncbi:MAG: hypothetical protein ACPGJS_20805 [Flammeovirgaceae bacterium]
MYLYKGFSLIIASEIEFPEFVPIEADADQVVDLTIKVGKTPELLAGTQVLEQVYNWATPEEFLLHIIDIVRFHLIGGHTLIIEPFQAQPDWNSIRTFCLSSMMSAALHFKNILPLHASAIKHQEGLVLFCGISGSGKSTTSLFLNQRGYPLFCDDICVVRPENIRDGKVYAQASYPMSRIWEDTIQELNDSRYHTKNRVRAEIAKFGNYFHDTFDHQALPIKQIINLGAYNLKEIKTRPITSKLERLTILNVHTFRRRQLEGLQKQADNFKLLSQLTDIPMTNVSRPVRGVPISTLIDLIEDEFLKPNAIQA